MSNPTGKGGFKKGDPRINRNGRPKSFDALRKLAQQLTNEVAKDRDGNELIRDGHKVTVAELILWQWAGDKKRQKDLLEVAFGKVPQELNLHSDGGLDIGVNVVDYRRSIAPLAPGSIPDSDAPGQDKNLGDG